MTRGGLGRRLKLGLLTACLALGLWLAGLIWFAETIPRAPERVRQATDVIVVLTGGSDRLATGLDLLTRGLAKQLFISGVHRGVDLDDMLRAGQRPEIDLSCCVVLGHEAGNTVGNAAETAAWMRARGHHSLRLVTANYHMRRSLLEFRMAMPEAEILAHPVAPDSVRLAGWWRWPGTLSLITMEYVKYLITAGRYALHRGLGP